MGQGHAHRAGGADDGVDVPLVGVYTLLGALSLAAIATLIGLLMWWPSGDPAAEIAESGEGAASFAAPGVTFPDGEIVTVGRPCDGAAADDQTCGRIAVRTDEGKVDVGVPDEVLESGIGPGDRLELMRVPSTEKGGEATYSYFATDRDSTLIWLAVVFLVVVLVIARWRGLFAIVGLAVGASVVWWFMLPALLDGAPGVGVALAGSAAIMYVVLYTTHGFSMRTSAALAGTLLGIGVTAGLGVIAIRDARLTGIPDETGALLGAFGGDLDFTSLLGCALVIAGLGVLNDVTITQASAVWELRASSPDASRREIFARAMRIGRDHIASTIYTIVFAYVGTALLLLMLLQVYGRPLIDLLSTEQLAEEVVRTLVTSIGLVLAVPITTALSAALAGPRLSPPD